MMRAIRHFHDEINLRPGAFAAVFEDDTVMTGTDDPGAAVAWGRGYDAVGAGLDWDTITNTSDDGVEYYETVREAQDYADLVIATQVSIDA